MDYVFILHFCLKYASKNKEKCRTNPAFLDFAITGSVELIILGRLLVTRHGGGINAADADLIRIRQQEIEAAERGFDVQRQREGQEHVDRLPDDVTEHALQQHAEAWRWGP